MVNCDYHYKFNLGARISLKGKRLDIPRLRQSHVGEYSCIATNEAGRAEAVVHIDVLGKICSDIIKRF